MNAKDSIFGAEPERLRQLIRSGMDVDGVDAEENHPASGSVGRVMEHPGTQIGGYKLLHVLGEGGMGVVYLAEQEHLIRRRVALKIIKPGMDSRRVLARFDAERQALALLDHPNIAHVYDAGMTAVGRPYFVMEYVKGLPITEYCDHHRLSIEDRLALFVQVCQAVQHAHQKGIIHRDIKPSNILVSAENDRATPKIIDFGVAKAIGRPLTDRTLVTEDSHLLGTPEYMSPEQADMASEDIDTRSDVYSLGVLLYVLLTGVLPFDPQTLRDSGIENIRRTIRETDPKTPSTRLTGLGEEAAKIAERRGTEIHTLAKNLKKELEWIPLKAMRKERAERYRGASELADDVENYLNGAPLIAAPPGTIYRLRKLVRRHRQALAAAGTLVALVLVLLWAIQAHVRAGALEHEHILAEAQKLFDTRGTQVQGTSDPSSEALAKIEPLLMSRYVGPQAQLLSATILVEHGYYADAVPRLENLLDGRAEIAGAAYALLARTIWEGPSLGPEEVKKAEEYQKKAEELLPRTAEAYYLRAMAALTILEKLDLLKQALDLDRDHYPSRRLLALTYYVSRKYELLSEEALLMTHLRPTDPLGWSLRAAACRELGKCDEAISWYDRAIGLVSKDDPQYADLNARRCDVLLRMGQYERLLAEVPTGIEDASPLQYRIFCALTALGKYEEASALFRCVSDAKLPAGAKFKDWYIDTELRRWSMKYAFDAMEAGRSWHPSDSIPEGPAFLGMFEAEEMYRSLLAKARPLIRDGFAGRWSPDGTKVVFSMGTLGNSGVAIYDLKTRQTDLLIVPGKNPSWSPDGGYIAFARDRTVLSLSEFTGAKRRYLRRFPSDAEVWVMKADGTDPRHLASTADWPSWSADSKHLYYQLKYKAVQSISVDDIQARPTSVIPSRSRTHAVSPDGRYVAHTESGSLQIMDLVSQSQVAEWLPPLTVWPKDWSPDGREISLGGGLGGEVPAGLWIYDFDRKEAAQVLSGRIGTAFWSPDKTRLLIGLSEPYCEIWVADLDPGLSTVEAMGPARNLEEHCREVIDLCTRELAVDPNLMDSHRDRLVCALWIGDDRVPLYLQEFEHTIDRVPLHPYFCDQIAEVILLDPPPVRDRLGPMALLCARKAAEKDAGYARALAPLFLKAGQSEEAARLWQIGKTTGNFLVNGGFEDGDRRPWETLGQMDLEVVTELHGATVPEKPVEGQYCLYADVAHAAAYFYSAAICPVGAVFEAGKKYTISAFLKARKGKLDVCLKPERNTPPWPEFGQKTITITDTWAEYYVTTPVFAEDVVPAHFAFLVGTAQGGLWIDDVRFYEGDYVPMVTEK